MILILSDLHSRFEHVNTRIRHAEEHAGCAVDHVVIIGDVGIYPDACRRFFDQQAKIFDRPVSYIEGNHEDWDDFHNLSKRYDTKLRHLPRGTVHEIDGFRILAIGGAAYMDAMLTPRGCIIDEACIDRCLLLPDESVDLIVSHDCPQGIGIPNTPGFEYYGTPGFVRGLELAHRFTPADWVFGHHHKWFNVDVGGVHFHGMSECWKGYGLLRKGHPYETVEHIIPLPKRTWVEKFLACFGIAPSDDGIEDES